MLLSAPWKIWEKRLTTMMEEVEIKWEQRLKFSPRGHLHRHHDAVAALDARLPGDVLHTTPFAFCPCFLVVFFSGTWTWREKKEPPEDQDAGLGAKSLAGLYIMPYHYFACGQTQSLKEKIKS